MSTDSQRRSNKSVVCWRYRSRKPARARLFPGHAHLVTEDAAPRKAAAPTGTSRRVWRSDLSEYERQARIAEAFATLPHADRLKHVCRPEEYDEAELLAPVWPEVNRRLGTNARSLPELVEQLGIARFGHRPKVADTFCGGGSIPFEAARIGCDVYASDLNPIACMLTWGAFNIIGAPREKRAEIERAQREVAGTVDAEITRLGIEHDAHGNRAKAKLLRAVHRPSRDSRGDRKDPVQSDAPSVALIISDPLPGSWLQ